MWHRIYEVAVSYKTTIEAKDVEEAKEKVRGYILAHPQVLQINTCSAGGYDDLQAEEQSK